MRANITKHNCFACFDANVAECSTRANGDARSNHGGKQAEQPGNASNGIHVDSGCENLGSPVEEILINAHEFDSSPDDDAPIGLAPIASSCYPKEVDKTIRNAMFIAQHIDNADEFNSVRAKQRIVRIISLPISLSLNESHALIVT